MKISIITISFNSEGTIENTIKSVISQNYKDLEYIIVDGLSTDNTMKIISRYKEKIDIIISEKDRGISDAFNKGINLASGELIGIINSDDMLYPNAIQIIANIINDDTEILFGNAVIIKNDKTNFIKKSNPNLQYLMKNMSLMHPATFVKKTAYEKYGYFSLDYKCVMDRELLLRMYKKGAKFQYIDKLLAFYTLGGISSKIALSVTIPENRRISVEYGVPKIKAKIEEIKNKINFIMVEIFRMIKIESFMRKVLKKN